MRRAAIEPERVRWDVLLLQPDLYRPGFALRCPADDDTLAAPADPAALCERVETELAEMALLYRRVLLSGAVALAAPGVAFAGLRWIYVRAPLGLWLDPFSGGRYFPGPSVFEVLAFALLLAAVAWGMLVAPAMWRTSCRLSADYRRLRDADDERRSVIAREAVGGRWPRTAALLRRGRPFAPYREPMAVAETE